jgi:hypothetical protein
MLAWRHPRCLHSMSETILCDSEMLRLVECEKLRWPAATEKTGTNSAVMSASLPLLPRMQTNNSSLSPWTRLTSPVQCSAVQCGAVLTGWPASSISRELLDFKF